MARTPFKMKGYSYPGTSPAKLVKQLAPMAMDMFRSNMTKRAKKKEEEEEEKKKLNKSLTGDSNMGSI